MKKISTHSPLFSEQKDATLSEEAMEEDLDRELAKILKHDRVTVPVPLMKRLMLCVGVTVLSKRN